ncbi:MAG TPA: peptidoglycan DD-metalloendopeptidase family protein [Steroidobacteraceae bacterium]|nr:peptidoglycan DD-metalloendopeptidase family protein [Steroidobacteraceae bacterium]
MPETYIVRPRDTLYSIAWRHDLDYRDLARWNHIGPDYRIAVGQVLMLTPRGPRAESPAAPSVRTLPAPGSLLGGAPGAAVAGAEPSPRAAASPGQPCSPLAEEEAGAREDRWRWPTAHVSAPHPVPGGGILLLGELGQPIRAACPGRVVYAGSGIRGYGNLIIIKHGATLLSAYAHTIDVSVHEGQQVSAGESIARMGTGSHRIAVLYFEIRLNGKPVDPLAYLPRERD